MMRRNSRTLLILVVVTSVLLLVLRQTRQPRHPSPRRFSWTSITYKTTAARLPKPVGVCPKLQKTSKPALIVSHVEADGDLKWLDTLATTYHICAYLVDAPPTDPNPTLRVPANRGHEAMAYLTFIIDNYEHIPTAGAVFVHGSRWSWHNDHPTYDNAPLLRSLNLSAALHPTGYHNLRCDWGASMCDYTSAKPQNSWGTRISAALEPYNERAVSDAALPVALVTLFGGGDGGEEGRNVRLPRDVAVRAQCCAQFVVARDRIVARPREDYVRLRQWLLDDGAAPRNDRVAGRVLSYMWHLLFMRPDWLTEGEMTEGGGDGVDLDRLNELACPSAADCYCRLYGRCNLPRCALGRCHGEYAIPPDFTLPKDWAETHA